MDAGAGDALIHTECPSAHLSAPAGHNNHDNDHHHAGSRYRPGADDGRNCLSTGQQGRFRAATELDAGAG